MDVSGGYKKNIKILCKLKVNIQDGIGYLSSFDSFLHVQSIFVVVIILFSFKDDRGELSLSGKCCLSTKSRT